MSLNLIAAVLAVVAFKDAAKIKSWDAWDDHKAPVAWNEKPCVTREKLLKMDPGLEPWGWLETRGAKDIKSSWWSVGCETLDRDYADWNQYKAFLGPLGVKHARFFSGWAKTEQVKGKYDFTWLDPQIRECAAMGVKPWVCISYGNPVWGSDFRLGMRVRQVTDNPEAFAAWIRYVKALVARYKDVVDEWEIWNEPFGQAREYAEMVYATAKAVHEVQPSAKCFVTAICWNNDPPKSDYAVVLEKLKKENALDLVDRWIYHPYEENPDRTYGWALALRTFVKSYSPRYDILQGEVGCPSQLEFAHALANIEWTEYAQAKWDLRRAIGDRVRDIPSNLFTFIDLQYTFMLQSFGLVRSNTLKEPVYRRPSYFAMQNVYSYFDDNVYPVGVEKREVEVGSGSSGGSEGSAGKGAVRKELTVAKFERRGTPIHVVWFSGERPGDSLAYARADLSFIRNRDRLAWVDLMTGRICKLPDVKSVPVWDSPVMIVPTWEVERRIVWSEMTPAEIVDSVYRPYEGLFPSWINGVNIKMDVSQEPWTKMKTEEFLPCFDRYGQFKWREWPGKTHSDEELKASAADEERDLAAHPGPDGRDAFGGWAKGPKREATGRFRTEKIDGAWWLVDPEGNLFWSWGPVRVTPSSAMTPLNGVQRSNSMGGGCPDRDCLFEDLPAKGTPLAAFYDTYDALLLPFYLKRGETRRYDFSAANLFRKFGADWFARYSDLCHRRLRSWGCNTIANSSDLRICLQDRTPYAERVECESRTIEGSWGQWGKFRDPFDPSFTAGVTEVLKAHGREAHDKWCIGFFIDNEINWGWADTMLAEWTLRSPEDQPARIEFVKRLKAKGIDPLRDKVPAEELRAFTAALTEEYFRKTRETVKAFDPKLLYLGCRFAGSRAPAWAIGPCVKYADVVSYNIYAEEIGSWRLPEGLDAPVLIGEFHFGAHDRGLFGSGLCNAGDQKGRAAALRKYVESALRNPQVVGAHWHQFSDQATSGRFDGEYFQVGWTDICDRPYAETVEALRSLDIYAVRGTPEQSMSGAVRKLVLIGGYGDWENGQIVAFAEKKDPVVLTFSAASGDEPKYCEVLRGRFLKYTPNVESVTLVPNPPADELPGIRRKILAADILYFSGGATEELVKTIIHNHLGDTIRIAYRRGTVLSGFSAGSMLFVHAGFTDYPKKRYDLVEGLNIVPCFFGPHYQGRQWKAFDARLAEETDPSLPSEAWALEDGVSLFFRDEVPEVRRHLPDSHVWHFTRDAQGVWQKEDATHWNDAPVVETDPARTASAWRLCEGVLCEVDAQGAPVADGWCFAAKGTAEAIELGPVVRPGTGGVLDFSSQPIVRVADAAFLNGGTNGMTSVKLPPSLREIGNWAFQNVTSLKSVDFGTDSQLVSFGNAAFKGCTALSEVKPLLPEGVADMWDVFENCPLTGTLRLGFGAAKEFALLHSSFRNHRLSAIELGPKVVELDHWVFMSDGNTTLTNVTVGGTLRRVGQNVFRGCTALPPECIPARTPPSKEIRK